MTPTLILETAEAEIAYGVHGPLPTADGRPPLFMIGQPMAAGGFATSASHFPDGTVLPMTRAAWAAAPAKTAGSTMCPRSRPTTCTP